MDNDGYESDRSNNSSTSGRDQLGDNESVSGGSVDEIPDSNEEGNVDDHPATGDTEDGNNADEANNQTTNGNGRDSHHKKNTKGENHIDINKVHNKPTKGETQININEVGSVTDLCKDGGNDVFRRSIVLRASDLLKNGHYLKGRDGDEEDTLINVPRRNGSARFSVQRNVLDQQQFDESYVPGARPSPTLRQRVKKKASKCSVSGPCCKDFLFTLFPFIQILKTYNIRTDIMGDIVSGLTVGIMHIPQGMAYGMLTTLPPVYGLYMSFFPVLTYFLFGSSRHISIGTFAVACLMTGSAVSKGYLKVMGGGIDLDGGSGNSSNTTGGLPTDEGSAMSQEELNIRLQFAMSMTFMVGVVQLIMGIFRLGFVTVYLSDPLISGFTTGAACHVFTSQIKHVFGIKTERYSGAFKLIYTYRDFFMRIGQTNGITVAISVVCMVILYCTSRFINQNPKLKPKMIMPVPIELIVVVLGTVISFALKLEENHNVVVVSDIPTGLPVPNLNCFTQIPDVISDAIALAIVIFAVSISMAKILAKKHDYEVNANQELVAFGLSTIFSSFFSAAAPSASLSRSLVQERVGGKTQITGLFSCVLLLVVLLAIGPYFRTLPNCILAATIVVALGGLFYQVFELPELWRRSKIDFCVLASIIIIALRGMFLQILDLKKLWNVSKIDFFVWIIAFLATVVLDVDLGLGVAVIFAILTVVCRSQRPYTCLLGQMPDTDIYRDINIYQEAKEIPGLKIFRFENSLFFVNTEHFRTCLYKRTVNPRVISIARKKREAKAAKLKNTETLVLGELQPDVTVPADTTNMEIELEVTNNEVTMRSPLKDKNNHQDVDFHTIILDCSSWSFVDSMAVKVLTAVIGEYKSIGVNLFLANCKAGIREMFTKTNFYETLENSRIFVSVHDAVLHAQAKELENHENGIGSGPEDDTTLAIEDVDETAQNGPKDSSA